MSNYARHGLMQSADLKPDVPEIPGERCVIHLDMDAYFASVEQRDIPMYRGKPLIVCHTASDFRSHGIVATCSYEARRWGVKTGMSVWEARAKCPHGVYVHANMSKYLYNTKRIVEICQSYTHQTDVFSIDEVFLDVTKRALEDGGQAGKWEAALDIGSRLKGDIRRRLGLTTSVGVGPNRLVAKMAGEFDKPDGLTLVTPGQLPDILAPLPVDKIVGIGRRMKRNFDAMGVQTIGEIAETPRTIWQRRFGVMGVLLHQASLGVDQGRVGYYGEDNGVKSYGHSLAFKGTFDLDLVRNIMLGLCEAVARRMRRDDYIGRTVNMRLRIGYAMGFSRAETMEEYTDLAAPIFRTACRILAREAALGAWADKITCVGISVSNVKPARERQFSLQDWRDPRERRLAEAQDRLKDKYGDSVIMRASLKEKFALSGMNLIR